MKSKQSENLVKANWCTFIVLFAFVVALGFLLSACGPNRITLIKNEIRDGGCIEQKMQAEGVEYSADQDHQSDVKPNLTTPLSGAL